LSLISHYFRFRFDAIDAAMPLMLLPLFRCLFFLLSAITHHATMRADSTKEKE